MNTVSKRLAEYARLQLEMRDQGQIADAIQYQEMARCEYLVLSLAWVQL